MKRFASIAAYGATALVVMFASGCYTPEHRQEAAASRDEHRRAEFDHCRAEGRTDCDAIPMPADVTRAVETRIADLKARGGTCSRYGTVLETSYRSGRIIIRPFMWRVGSNLASGEAKPNGDMTLAREIDSLNVGVRTVDDVLWSMEHEAVHIALGITSGEEASEVRADRYVRSCKT